MPTSSWITILVTYLDCKITGNIYVVFAIKFVTFTFFQVETHTKSRAVAIKGQESTVIKKQLAEDLTPAY